MFIYLTNIFITLLLAHHLLFKSQSEDKIEQNKKLFCCICSVLWILISGLRNWDVGADTFMYSVSFQNINLLSWKEVLTRCFVNYFRTSEHFYTYMAENLYKDPGYLVFQKFFYWCCRGNYQLYLLVIAIILFSSLGYFIYKNSENPCFSFILFSTLFYAFYAVTGLRQTIATSLVVFWGNQYIQERKIIPYTLLFLVAFTIHKSALIFYPFYFIATMPITRKYVIVLLSALIFLIFGGGSLILWVAGMFGYVREENYLLIPLKYITLMSFIGLFFLLFYDQVQRQSKNKRIEIHGTLLATVFTILTIFDQSMMRVQQYFALYLMLSIPSLLRCFPPKTRCQLYVGAEALLIFLLILNHPRYAFFWEPL